MGFPCRRPAAIRLLGGSTGSLGKSGHLTLMTDNDHLPQNTFLFRPTPNPAACGINSKVIPLQCLRCPHTQPWCAALNAGCIAASETESLRIAESFSLALSTPMWLVATWCALEVPGGAPGRGGRLNGRPGPGRPCVLLLTCCLGLQVGTNRSDCRALY